MAGGERVRPRDGYPLSYTFVSSVFGRYGTRVAGSLLTSISHCRCDCQQKPGSSLDACFQMRSRAQRDPDMAHGWRPFGTWFRKRIQGRPLVFYPWIGCTFGPREVRNLRCHDFLIPLLLPWRRPISSRSRCSKRDDGRDEGRRCHADL